MVTNLSSRHTIPIAYVVLFSAVSLAPRLAWGQGSPVFHLDFSKFMDVSGNNIDIEVGDAVSLVPGGGPKLATGRTLDSARWEGVPDDTNQIIIFDHPILDAVSVGAGSIVAWIKPDDGDEWNNIAKTPCEDHIEPCDAFSQFRGIEFQASGPHAGVFGSAQGWDTNVFGPDSPPPFGNGSGDTDTPSGEWTHTALVWNEQGDHTIFVNGEPGDVFVGVGNDDFGLNEPDDWTIGGDALGTGANNPDATRHLSGELADFAIFDRELSRQDLMEIIRSGVPSSGVRGDFNRDGKLDAIDVNLLIQQIIAGTNPNTFDVNGDSMVNPLDLRVWAKDVRNTWIGDANLDGEFNSGDFVIVFQSGKFERDVAARWEEGDWTGDGRFNSGDFVAAFQDGGFEKGPRAAAAVPEPGAFALSLSVMPIVLCGMARRRRLCSKRGVTPRFSFSGQ